MVGRKASKECSIAIVSGFVDLSVSITPSGALLSERDGLSALGVEQRAEWNVNRRSGLTVPKM